MSTSAITRACLVYCSGELLKMVQLSGVYNDSKTFVDMPMRYAPEFVLTKFNFISNKPGNINPTELQVFLDHNFYEAGSDILQWVPTDYNSNPDFILQITNITYQSWAKDLNDLWLTLGREHAESVSEFPERQSYLPRKYPFIVPGGRFRETYYWDSLWIIKGLLVCGMYDTSLGMIQNLLQDVENYGFVPNGGRIYYLDRSQPPVLSEIVLSYTKTLARVYNGTFTSKLVMFLSSAYETLKKEYDFWMDERSGHLVTIGSARLNRYSSQVPEPRPESYLEDYTTAGYFDTSELYTHLRAAAESGWDFSSRWIRQNDLGEYKIENVHTLEIVPVDLNSFMYKFEVNMVEIATLLLSVPSDIDDADLWNDIDFFTMASSNRKIAISEYLWDPIDNNWKDFNLTAKALGKSVTALSSWIPMWANLTPTGCEDKVVASLKQSGLIQVAGIATTNVTTGQQWDSPNSWAPLILLMIQGLISSDVKEALVLAKTIAENWLATCYIAYSTTGYMYEKYDAYVIGKGGGGGEYAPQIGFGWSNGVVLTLLAALYDDETMS